MKITIEQEMAQIRSEVNKLAGLFSLSEITPAVTINIKKVNIYIRK